MMPPPPPSFGSLTRQTAEPHYSAPLELYYQVRHIVFTKFPSWLTKKLFPQPVYHITLQSHQAMALPLHY